MLVAIGRRGKWVLPLGLVAALVLPRLADLTSVVVGPLMGLLLVISFLQLNDSDLQASQFSWSPDMHRTLFLLLTVQLVLPLVVLFLMRMLSVPIEWQIPISLVGAASCTTGGPSMVMMLGGNGGAAIRLLVCSTLALPFTAFPVLALLPLYSSHFMLIKTSMMLALVVLGAYAVAKILRKVVLSAYSLKQREILDGLATIALVFIAVGLMASIHTAWSKPNLLLKTLFLACAINFAYQILGLGLNRLFSMELPVVWGVVTGNRAVAIFLTALPASTYQPFLLFIACYQVPMYLTPLLGDYIYRRYTRTDSRSLL